MKALDRWNSFTPSLSKIDQFYGGVYPEFTYDQFNNRNSGGFCAVTYRLMVNAAHNGWHHFVGMHTSVQGVAWANACAKEGCRPGEYQFTFHFSFPHLHHNPGTGPQGAVEYSENSYRYSLFYGQDDTSGGNPYGTNGTWANGKLMDIMVLRPTLVNSQNHNEYFKLWDDSAYNGWQMYFTGFPIVKPTHPSATYEL